MTPGNLSAERLGEVSSRGLIFENSSIPAAMVEASPLFHGVHTGEYVPFKFAAILRGSTWSF
jgi:hypothetical protein